MLSSLIQIYQSVVIERPKLTLFAVFAAILMLAAGLPNFKLDASSDSLTLENDKDLDYFREVAKRYQSGDFLLITFKPYEDLMSDQALNALLRLQEELKTVQGISGVTSILNVPLLYSPKVALNEIATPRTILTEGVNREDARTEFLSSPIYKELILGPDGQTTALLLHIAVDEKFISLVRERDDLRLKRRQDSLTPLEERQLARVSEEFLAYRTAQARQSHQRVSDVRAIVERHRGEAELFVGGASMITSDMLDFIRADLRVFGVTIFVLMIAIMFIIFRRPRYVVLPMLTCFASVTMMLGYLSWVDWRLTVISSNFVALLLIISLAITIHLVVRYREYHAEFPDDSKADLVMRAVKYMALPCLYTTLTTIVAFASLVVSDIRPVIDFGWLMVMGLTLSLILAFIIIPAGLMLTSKGQPSEQRDNTAAFTTLFSKFTERFPNGVLLASLGVALAAGWGISRLEVENRFIDYFHDSTEIYRGLTVIDQNFGGTINLDITLDAGALPQLADGFEEDFDVSDFGDDSFGDEDPFAEADAMDAVDPFVEEDPFGDVDPFGEVDPFSDHGAGDAKRQNNLWFTVAGIDVIKSVHEYLDTLPEVGKVQSLYTAYEVGSDVSGSSLNDFELALMKNSLPDAIGDVLISPYLSEEYGQTRIALRAMETDPNLRRAELLEQIHDYLIDDLKLPEDKVHMSGLLVLYNNMLQSLFVSQIETLGTVFFGIMIMFMVLFRSLKVAIIAIIPNILAACAVLGGMGLMGIPLDMMTITVAAIAVGIGVDDTIHYIHRFKTEFSVDGNYLAAMHRSHASIGRAMFYTSIIIIVGFSVLTLSKFIPSIYFGLLTGLAMLAAILAALTLLPRLIVMTKPFGSES